MPGQALLSQLDTELVLRFHHSVAACRLAGRRGSRSFMKGGSGTAVLLAVSRRLPGDAFGGGIKLCDLGSVWVPGHTVLAGACVVSLDLLMLVAMSPWLVVEGGAIARSWWPVKHDGGKLVLGLTMLAVQIGRPAVLLLLRQSKGPGVDGLRATLLASRSNTSSRADPHAGTRSLRGLFQRGTPSGTIAVPLHHQGHVMPVSQPTAGQGSSSSIAAAMLD